jgi:hypothetical protein
MDTSYIISVSHSIIAIVLTSYGILFRRSIYDFLILIILFSILLTWTFTKGECIISYYVKKYKEPDYKMGSDIHTKDMFILFGEKYSPYLKFFYTIITPLIGTITIYLLLKRQKFTSIETLFYPIFYYGYHYISFLQSSMINLLFTLVFAFILYRIVKRCLKIKNL